MSDWVRRHLDRWSNLSERMPVDVLPASNGEFLPPPPTQQQIRIMQLQNRRAEELRQRLGMSRRTFVRSASAIGVGFWAVNQMTPGKWGRYLPGTGIGEAAPIGDDACALEFPEAQLNNLPGEFIFDVQTHHVDSGGEWRVNNPGIHAAFMALWSQSGPLGGFPHVGKDGHVSGFGKGGEVDPIENLSRYHYLKTLFLDSSTNMTVLSCVPSQESQQPLPMPEAHETVQIVNHLANSPRTVMHAFAMPNRGSYGIQPYAKDQRPAFQQAEFDLMEQHVRQFKDVLRGWKVYTPWGDVPYASGWFLDDEIGMAFIDQVRKLTKLGGPPVIACHKGFALPAFDHRAASPRDIGPAARQNPDINFVVYHSGFDSEKQDAYPGDDKVNSADRGVDCFIKSLRENDWDATRFVPHGLEHGNVPNVYAEIGSTMASVLGDPDEAAHLLGKLVTYVGALRIAWGTDSLWFGSPQPIITGLRSLHFTQRAREFYNLPHGLDGDAWDPRVNALSPHSYARPHKHVKGWPTDKKAHPERTIRNRIFGRNAAVVYQVDPDVARHKISCDDVQKIRDGYVINPATPKEVRPFATNKMPAGRTPQQVLANSWPNTPFTP